MKKSNKFSPDVRERAVRMAQEHRGEYPSLWAAIESIAPKIDCIPQTLLNAPHAERAYRIKASTHAHHRPRTLHDRLGS